MAVGHVCARRSTFIIIFINRFLSSLLLDSTSKNIIFDSNRCTFLCRGVDSEGFLFANGQNVAKPPWRCLTFDASSRLILSSCLATFIRNLGPPYEEKEAAMKLQIKATNRPEIKQRRTESISYQSPILMFALWRPVRISTFSKTRSSITSTIFLQFLSRGWTLQYVTRIFLFRDIRRSGKIEGYTREVAGYLFMSKTSIRPRWLRNGPQCLNPIFNNFS